MLRINVLSIAGIGLLMLVTGLLLFAFQDSIAGAVFFVFTLVMIVTINQLK